MEKDSIEGYFRRVIRPKFEEVLKEMPKTQVLGGGWVDPGPNHFYYRPHNFRRWIDFSKKFFNRNAFKDPGATGNRGLGSFISGGDINSGAEWIGEFENFQIRVKRNQIQILNKIDANKIYRLPLSVDGCKQIERIVSKKEAECLEAVQSIILIAGGVSRLKILNRKQEDKISYEDAISQIPQSQIFHTPLFKKVYSAPSIEFYDTASTVNYLTNRAIENISPEIADSLNNLSRYIETINPLRVLKLKINCLDDLKDNGHIIKFLDDSELHSFENLLFSRFGISP